MQTLSSLQIQDCSPVPKYVQLANYIGSQIRSKSIPRDAHLPSINLLCAHHDISRDTVRKAYMELKRRHLVEGVRGKGYFVNYQCIPNSKPANRIILILDRLGRYEESWYQEFRAGLSSHSQVDIRFHHGDPELLSSIYQQTRGTNDSFLIVGAFPGVCSSVVRRNLSVFPSERTVFLEHCPAELTGDFSSVTCDWSKSLLEALQECNLSRSSYSSVLLHFERKAEMSTDLLDGFQRYCISSGQSGKLVTDINDEPIEPGKVFILSNPRALTRLIGRIDESGLRVGQDIGLLFVGDHPLLEVVASGVTALRSDPKQLAAQLTREIGRSGTWRHTMMAQLIRRNSL